MTCEEFVELVSTYLDAALEPEQEAAFLDHLRRCPPCSVFLDQFALTVRILAGVSGPATIKGKRQEELMSAFRVARG
jgi:predicted anti-sigma-YlaC factor YlaD